MMSSLIKFYRLNASKCYLFEGMSEQVNASSVGPQSNTKYKTRQILPKWYSLTSEDVTAYCFCQICLCFACLFVI